MEQHFSAPGRIELGGNHTDHQHGCVLAAAVDLEMTAAVTPNGAGTIRVFSHGFAPAAVDIGSWDVRPEERHTTAALVRGVAAQFAARGAALSGVDIRVTSQVPVGSGLSSSAAFEVLLGRVFSGLFCGGSVPPEDIARMGQAAERDYFGKPCGLMDQLAASVGGAVAVDFLDLQNPKVESIPCDFDRMGYALYVVNAGGSHAGLTSEYAAIPPEMGSVAAYFGKKVLREVDEQTFYSKLGELRGKVSDRAILRAMHFFGDDRRAVEMAQALRAQDVEAYKAIMLASGASSMSRLENIYPAAMVEERSVALALALSEELLAGKGAWRIQGGGFAGTIQALVPHALCQQYEKQMQAVFGPACCNRLYIRPVGGYLLKED